MASDVVLCYAVDEVFASVPGFYLNFLTVPERPEVDLSSGLLMSLGFPSIILS